MTTSDLPALKRRLRKVLALTKSSEPGEAAAALHQARKLMELHGLSERDALDIREAELKLSGADISEMEGAVASVIRKTFGVEILVQRQPKTAGHRRRRASVIFVGEGPSPDLAVYAFANLRRMIYSDLDASIERFQRNQGLAVRKLAIPPVAKQAYAQGWCASVRRHMTQFGGVEPSPAVCAYLASRQSVREGAPVRKLRGPGGVFASDFRNLGLLDGREVRLNMGVNTAAGQTLIAR